MGYTEDAKQRGRFGQYVGSILVSGISTYETTGSQYGVEAIMVSGSVSGTATLGEGGTIDLTTLSAGEIYKLGVSQVSVTSVTGGVYLLLPNSQRSGN
jgi:hypothetical protein